MGSTHLIQCADLFCGAGGLSYGLQQAGIDVRVGVDQAASTEFPYRSNLSRPVIVKDIRNVSAENLLQFFSSDVKVLVGCAPCQPFSTLSPTKCSHQDPRRSLIFEFLRITKRMCPELIVMENVPSLRHTSEFQEFSAEVKRIGYHIALGILNFVDYGVPQNRKRLILLASKMGGIQLPAPTIPLQKKTISDVIKDLPPIEAGLKNEDDPLHRAPALSWRNLQRIQASKPGGTWRDWPGELLSPCHKRADGKNFLDSYGRMDWSKPSPTITTRFFTYGCGRFGHPEQDRAITFREASLLQTFPMEYKFVPDSKPFRQDELGNLIGNAVPPRIAKILGKTIIKHVKTYG